MNLLDRAKAIPHGLAVITKWLGSGGEVVEPEVSQERADICNGKNPTNRRCPHNDPSFPLTEKVAIAVRQYLSVKNKLELRVDGEKSLGTCAICTCELRLQVHEPQEKVQREMTDEERTKLPPWCWKLKP